MTRMVAWEISSQASFSLYLIPYILDGIIQ